MKLELTIAGVCWLVLALGHTVVGLRWVLPSLTPERLPSTPLGSSSWTVGMLRFTWLIVSLILLGFGVLFILLAFAPDADPKTLLLRWVAVLMLFAMALAVWNARHRPSSLLRRPAPLGFLLIAALSWAAST
jgi:hypothetical protein